jgi:hypothetical protein
MKRSSLSDSFEYVSDNSNSTFASSKNALSNHKKKNKRNKPGKKLNRMSTLFGHGIEE